MDYAMSKLIHYETCPDCGQEFDIDQIDNNDAEIYGCCDHLTLSELFECYSNEMRPKLFRAMERLDRAANTGNRKMEGYKIGDVVMVSATITEKIETKDGFFYTISPFHTEITPHQSMKAAAADIFPAQKSEVSK